MSGRLLTTREVASRLGLSSATVLRRWRAGELPGYRLGTNVLRFSEGDIDAWLGSTYEHAQRVVSSNLPRGTSARTPGSGLIPLRNRPDPDNGGL